MKLPHIYYLKALVAGRLSNKEILLDLEDNGLSIPAIEDLKNLRERMKLGHEEYFEDKNESVDVAWLDELQITELFGWKFDEPVGVGVEHIAETFEVLNDPLMYRTITSLALCGVDPEDIELVINAKYDLEYSSDDLDSFLHYFFNLEEWNFRDKVNFVDQVKDDKNLRYFYNIALENDQNFLLWKLDLAPQKSYDAMLREMMNDSFYSFKELARKNPGDAQSWGKLFLRISERLDKVETNEEEKEDMYNDLEIVLQSEEDESNSPAKAKNDPDTLAEINLDEEKVVPQVVGREELN